jgi:3-oxoadipate enol-lactonase
MRFISVNGRSLCVETAGHHDWPVVVFLNALGTDHRIWHDVLAQLSGVRTLRYDMPGHGLSEAEDAVSVPRLTSAVIALLDALEIRQAVLCGVSLGGLVAQHAAFAYPGRVTGLVLCATGYRIGSHDSWNERLELIASAGLAPASTRIVERWFTPAFRSQCPTTVTGYASMLARTDPASYAAFVRAIRDTDLEMQARQLHCRTLVLCGTDDLATPPATARSLAEAIPRARFALIPEAAHLPPIEQPAIVAGHISAFARPDSHVH